MGKKMTAQERQESKEFSEASQKLRKEGWKAYMYARMNGSSHSDALDSGFKADFAEFRRVFAAANPK